MPAPESDDVSDTLTGPELGGRSVCLVSLGCSKNLVDSEVMAGHLGRAGLTLVADPADSDVVIVNTCGFIDAAREESVDTILQYVELKRQGVVRGVVVSGCLVQIHEQGLAEELPEVDAFLPLSDYSAVPSIVGAVLGHGPSAVCPGGEASAAAGGSVAAGGAVRGGRPKGGDADLGRALLTPVHTAYLRLGEGCNHVCAFCAIPHIRGKLRSKPLEVLVEEAHALAALGTRELTLIAEDSTDYGKDLGAGYGLADLLAALGEVSGIDWVRVMYAHPATIDERLVATMAATHNVLPYIDMPIQHGDAGVLRAMRRGTSPDRIRRVVGWLRAAMPDVTLRTTILVGFPGETEEAFEHLLELLEELRFDRVGCFTFSPEESTEAHRLPGPVPRRLAESRRERVMRLQRDLMRAQNRARTGTTETVLVDAIVDGVAIARTRRDAPEIDGQVLVTLDPPARGGRPAASRSPSEPRPRGSAGSASAAASRPDGGDGRSAAGSAAAPEPGRSASAVQPGDFVEVVITGVKGYDLTGRLAHEPAPVR